MNIFGVMNTHTHSPGFVTPAPSTRGSHVCCLQHPPYRQEPGPIPYRKMMGKGHLPKQGQDGTLQDLWIETPREIE